MASVGHVIQDMGYVQVQERALVSLTTYFISCFVCFFSLTCFVACFICLFFIITTIIVVIVNTSIHYCYRLDYY